MDETENIQKDNCTCTCIICGETRNDGIMIIDEFICDGCEAEIVRTDVKDAKYPFFIHQLKRILYKGNINEKHIDL
ncbi:sigma factor G inhibitor Gin [Paenibacillus thalictri]|uniref:Inhibitor of sigma-G Gin n=1 Tax=Paenibacillus thalictri TaxID=2527873 RepID=A0A4Q9DD43_9BACL|nr:sigma factor G inhibitor Gin [Paenibacillus thalictri]TBL68996.1 inhibitor of sigma-G Gin [Paenibacillus thalictri]